jgi:hypothetical protein
MEFRLAEKGGDVPYCQCVGGPDHHIHLSRSLQSHVRRSPSSLDPFHGRGAQA